MSNFSIKHRISFDTFKQLSIQHLSKVVGAVVVGLRKDYSFYCNEHESYMKICRTSASCYELGEAIVQEEKLMLLQEALDI